MFFNISIWEKPSLSLIMFQGEILLDRKGDGSYEESSIVRRGLPDADNCPTAPPKKHVVEYMQVRLHIWQIYGFKKVYTSFWAVKYEVLELLNQCCSRIFFFNFV